MTTESVLGRLEELGVELTLNEGRILYRGRKDVLTPEFLEEIKTHKEGLVQLLRNGRSKSWKLSEGQKALWFLHELNPSSSAYHMAFCVKIKSPLQPQSLALAYQRTVLRHPLLHCRIRRGDEHPVLEIGTGKEITFKEIDARNWPDTELESGLVKAYAEPFDFQERALIRATLFILGTGEHILLITAHHIIFDGQSMWLVVQELFGNYEAVLAGKEWIAPQQKPSYRDYLARQEKFLHGAEATKQRSFWLAELKDLPPLLNFPSDRPASAQSSFTGNSQALSLSTTIGDGVKALARKEGATVFATLLTIYLIFLHRITGQKDILIGSATAGRNHPDDAGVVGYFINMIVNRAKIDDSQTFVQTLARVRKAVIGALNHQEYPYSLVVEAVQKNQGSARSSLFQAEFGLQLSQASGGILELFLPSHLASTVTVSGLEMSPHPLRQQEGQFDLSLELIEARGSFHGVFKYSAELFDLQSMETLAEYFQSLVGQVLSFPSVPIRELSIFTAAENVATAEILAACPITPANQWS